MQKPDNVALLLKFFCYMYMHNLLVASVLRIRNFDLFKYIYRIVGTFGVEFNLAAWRI